MKCVLMMLMEVSAAIVVDDYAYIVGGEIWSLSGLQYVKTHRESNDIESNVSRYMRLPQLD